MAINPSMTLVKVLRISDSMTNISNEKKDINVPHNMIWDLHIRHLSFLFFFLHSASLRLTSAMISRLDCLLLFFSVASFHLFSCHIYTAKANQLFNLIFIKNGKIAKILPAWNRDIIIFTLCYPPNHIFQWYSSLRPCARQPI